MREEDYSDIPLAGGLKEKGPRPQFCAEMRAALEGGGWLSLCYEVILPPSLAPSFLSVTGLSLSVIGKAQTTEQRYVKLKEKYSELVQNHADLLRKVMLSYFPPLFNVKRKLGVILPGSACWNRIIHWLQSKKPLKWVKVKPLLTVDILAQEIWDCLGQLYASLPSSVEIYTK